MIEAFLSTVLDGKGISKKTIVTLPLETTLGE